MKPSLAVAFAVALASVVAHAKGLATAITQDPATDATHPASTPSIQIASQGALMNGRAYLPPGAGPHPVVLLLHGFPGNEQNVDLAQAIRRAGWAVVTFNYRGSWGSGGTFTFDGAVADGVAALAWVRDPANANKLRIDPARVAMIGHSWGGYVTASACAADAKLLGCALIAPWDVSADVAMVKDRTPEQRDGIARIAFDDVDGRLTGFTARQTVDAIADRGSTFDLAKHAPGLADRRLLVVVASRDGDDCKALTLKPALEAAKAASFRFETIESDHSFNDRRIALAGTVLSWLDSLPH